MTYLNRIPLIVVLLCASCTTSLDTFDEEVDMTPTPGNPSGGGTDGGQSIPSNTGDEPELIQLSEPLVCESVMWCNSYLRESVNIQMPSTTGGTIADGIYQSVEGSTSLAAYIFENGRFSYIWANYTSAHGTFEVKDNDQFVRTITQSCSRNGTFDYNSPDISQFTYAVVGDSIYLKSVCDNPFCDGDSARRFQKVSTLCDIDSDFVCNKGSCACQQIVESDIPPKPSGPDECAPQS